ncbi:MAG: hypothetical protein JWM75_1175 [Sphingomonas bacterium]|nr:hypothetical protein [Sphingomonas bacterium]
MQALMEPRLSRSEWQAVSIAINDAARCGCAGDTKAGPVRRLYTALTGNAPPGPLADRRLEAIRSFVYETRRQRKPAERLVPDLVAHGFSRGQVDALALLSA